MKIQKRICVLLYRESGEGEGAEERVREFQFLVFIRRIDKVLNFFVVKFSHNILKHILLTFKRKAKFLIAQKLHIKLSKTHSRPFTYFIAIKYDEFFKRLNLIAF